MLLWLLDHVPSLAVHLFVLATIALYVIGPMFAPPASKEITKIAAIILFAFGLIIEGASWGAKESSADLKAALDKAKIENAELLVKSQQVTTKTVTEYVDRVKVITKKGEDRVVYVDKLITAQDNANCKLPDAWYKLHNDGAVNK